MTTKGWATAAFVAGGAIFAMRGGCLSKEPSTAPDKKLASRFDDLCNIAKLGTKDAVKGVQEMGIYLVNHTGDMMKHFGDTIALIELIRDDAKHDQRAHEARATMSKPLDACLETWVRFSEAIDANPEASRMVDTAGRRLERTLNIMFSGAGKVTFRGLPSQLERALDASLPR